MRPLLKRGWLKQGKPFNDKEHYERCGWMWPWTCDNREGLHYKIQAHSTQRERGVSFVLPSLDSHLYTINDCIEKQKVSPEDFVTAFGTELFDILFSDIKDFFHEYMDFCDKINSFLIIKNPLIDKIPCECC